MIPQITEYVSGEEIVSWAREFVKYPSPQTEKFEAEPAVLGFIEECFVPVLNQKGLSFRRDRMGNLILESSRETGPEASGPSLLLMAYAMTHPASRMKNPYEGALIRTDAGEAVRGRGVSEQKGCLAASLAAFLAALRRGNLRGRLVFALSTAGETGRHDAAKSILESIGFVPKFGIVVIGTSGRVCLANKGRIDVNIRIMGKACHSSAPWMGVNAIPGACEVMARLSGIDLSPHKHPELGAATLTPTSIRSFPEATHTVQDEVRMVYDRRLLPGEDPDAALEQIKSALSGVSPCKCSVERGAFMYPSEIEREGPLVSKIREGYRIAGVEFPELYFSHGALDAGFLNVKGCEGTMWGPGNIDQWHSDEETLLVDDLLKGARAYFGFIQAVMGEA